MSESAVACFVGIYTKPEIRWFKLGERLMNLLGSIPGYGMSCFVEEDVKRCLEELRGGEFVENGMLGGCSDRGSRREVD